MDDEIEITIICQRERTYPRTTGTAGTTTHANDFIQSSRSFGAGTSGNGGGNTASLDAGTSLGPANDVEVQRLVLKAPVPSGNQTSTGSSSDDPVDAVTP